MDTRHPDGRTSRKPTPGAMHHTKQYLPHQHQTSHPSGPTPTISGPHEPPHAAEPNTRRTFHPTLTTDTESRNPYQRETDRPTHDTAPHNKLNPTLQPSHMSEHKPQHRTSAFESKPPPPPITIHTQSGYNVSGFISERDASRPNTTDTSSSQQYPSLPGKPPTADHKPITFRSNVLYSFIHRSKTKRRPYA